MSDQLDIVIIGAGLSGIGAACHLKRECPSKTFAILEGRERSGGTWDLFRYPGIRSDSDMHTLGYDFKPWEEAKAIADGPAILKYVRETAEEHDVASLIEYQQSVKAANWDSGAQRWELSIEDGSTGATRQLETRFLLVCAGYYSYTNPHQPEFPGRDSFEGTFIHPQLWPKDLDYKGKKVVVIGSGATAMTLVPSMAEEAQEVVMLQRSPTYVVSRPAKDWLANLLRAVLPTSWAYAITRWKNTTFQHMLYKQTRTKPKKIKKKLLKWAKKELNGAASMEHFTPSYDPWDQRLCLVPDSDLFKALQSGKAKVVTAAIDTFTPDGIRLTSGEELKADIIISATGLELQIMGGMAITIDHQPFDMPGSWTYRGMMCSGLPNLVSVFGYINASWTLRADIVARWTCRLLNHMDETGSATVTPELEAGAPAMEPRYWIDDFSAGYMQRVMPLFPRQGNRDPWINSQRYFRERKEFAEMSFDEPALHFESARRGENEQESRHAA
ncbi:MAG: NAD(P)/FAD-dependent oxidoreductase [Pseudomonadota bacterium]